MRWAWIMKCVKKCCEILLCMWRCRRHVRPNSLSYVFVVGCHRSGTALVGQILGAHPNAIVIDEEKHSLEIVRVLLSGHVVGRLIQNVLARVRSSYANPTNISLFGRVDPAVTHLVLVAPSASFDFEAFQSAHRWNWHYLFPTRDVRDVVCSMRRVSHIPIAEDVFDRVRCSPELSEKFSSEIEGLNAGANSHSRATIAWQIQTSLHEPFSRSPLNACVFQYEELVSDGREWIPRLLSHVGLDESANGPLSHGRFYAGFNSGLTLRARDIDTFSVGSWEGLLTPEEECAIWSVGGDLMERCGYRRTPHDSRSNHADVLSLAASCPIVATGRGGSGTRLLAMALQELGVFLGTHSNGHCEDSIEWVDILYSLTIQKLTGQASDRDHITGELANRARSVFSRGNCAAGQPWGWKLPESMLVLPELSKAFPNAKFVHLVRHPLSCCLRRTHRTSRMNNPVGAATLNSAYQWLSWDHDPREDPDHIRNAASWVFQVEQVCQFGRRLGSDHYLELKYEELCESPQKLSDQLSQFLGVSSVTSELKSTIEASRMSRMRMNDSRSAEVWSICQRTAQFLGYSLSGINSQPGEPTTGASPSTQRRVA